MAPVGSDYRIVGAAWGAPPIDRAEVKINEGPWIAKKHTYRESNGQVTAVCSRPYAAVQQCATVRNYG
ncbi:hypothetical protein [Mesorhizobium sp. B2-6-1]|uniref:hypothetical protein n=1 Tax=Mesorhizobium sp. B2-6-1 TaxID=2589916 RepID=UPI001FED4CFC|nr:hypothetical protein [Mesorhizobium sp. B2-6-1]